eukprot:TRINITY_DN41815_c0_g1_i1.p1 TRINITY_DN41815_c0_g1~~TRINITY_DN41815_c0_g1_i1.p1  ORF type:complete len:228 (-),score=37.14 TRINITY_DN41815_c0_g1_i1:76-759(-)
MAGASPAMDSSLRKCAMPRDHQNLKPFKKTSFCSFFANGGCNRGEDCNFAHSTEEVRKKPNFVKTRLCAEFMEVGKCKSGSDCSFAHGKSELRGKGRQSRMTVPKMPGKRPEPCHADRNVHPEALLHLAKFTPIQIDNQEESLQWDPLCLVQLPAMEVHVQLEHPPSHFQLAQAVTVKNTFIHFHIPEDVPFVWLRRSKSLPACFDSDSDTIHCEGQIQMQKTESWS